MVSPIYALVSLLAASSAIAKPVAQSELSVVASSAIAESVAQSDPNVVALVAGISQVMPSGTTPPPAVPQGGGSDPRVTYLDPYGNWHTQQVNNPTALLNGNYVVSAIGGVNICSGNWAFLYQVPTPANYPSCQGNFGQFNTGDKNGARPYYNGLRYGTCPSSVFHWGVGGNQWGTQTYKNCWTGYWNWNTPNTGNNGISVFPNGMRVGYCCFN